MKTYRIIAPVSIKNIPDVPKGISIPIVFPMGDKVCVFIDTKFSLGKVNDLITDLLPDYNDNITIEEVTKTVPVQQLYNEVLIKYTESKE